MDRVDALRELLVNVEAGDIERYQRGAFKAIGFSQMNRALKAYNGSLDAAKALHEAVLPDWHWAIDSEDDNGVCVFNSGFDQAETAKSNYPARAWLIAIIKALIAQEEETK